eukprot:6106594-Amphidinium_carterae.1
MEAVDTTMLGHLKQKRKAAWKKKGHVGGSRHALCRPSAVQQRAILPILKVCWPPRLDAQRHFTPRNLLGDRSLAELSVFQIRGECHLKCGRVEMSSCSHKAEQERLACSALVPYNHWIRVKGNHRWPQQRGVIGMDAHHTSCHVQSTCCQGCDNAHQLPLTHAALLPSKCPCHCEVLFLSPTRELAEQSQKVAARVERPKQQESQHH